MTDCNMTGYQVATIIHCCFRPEVEVSLLAPYYRTLTLSGALGWNDVEDLVKSIIDISTTTFPKRSEG